MSDCSGKKMSSYGTKSGNMVQRNLSFLFQLDDDDLRQLDCV